MAWLNSDDLLAPGSLRFLGEYFATHPEVDVIYGDRIIIDDDDRDVGRWIMPRHNPARLEWIDYVPQETLFWRKSAWDIAGGTIRVISLHSIGTCLRGFNRRDAELCAFLISWELFAFTPTRKPRKPFTRRARMRCGGFAPAFTANARMIMSRSTATRAKRVFAVRLRPVCMRSESGDSARRNGDGD
jgi:hypothetical protein